MDAKELQDYYFRCICNTSAEYARHYVKKASLATLERCLVEIEGRDASKTLREMIERRIRQVKKGVYREGHARVRG